METWCASCNMSLTDVDIFRKQILTATDLFGNICLVAISQVLGTKALIGTSSHVQMACWRAAYCVDWFLFARRCQVLEIDSFHWLLLFLGEIDHCEQIVWPLHLFFALIGVSACVLSLTSNVAIAASFLGKRITWPAPTITGVATN